MKNSEFDIVHRDKLSPGRNVVDRNRKKDSEWKKFSWEWKWCREVEVSFFEKAMNLTAEEDETLNTYQTTAQQWAGKHATAGFWREEMKIFQRFLPVGKILEVGSGGGRDAKELIAFGYEYTGTDISSNFVEVARRKNPGATFLVQSVYDLEFSEDAQFDGFWASAVLLHIPKTKIGKALQRIRKCVKGGGIGFISLKQGEGERLEADSLKNGRFFSYYTGKEFHEVLLKNGFEVVQMKVHPTSEKTTWLCFFVRVSK